ncbi:MAG: tetratricopeptide repeat protein, partial [bacterium]
GQRALNQLNKLAPEDARTAKLGSRLFFRQEAYDTALVWAQRYRRRANDRWQPFHFLAQIHLQRDRLPPARDMVESAELRSDDNEWVLLDKLLVNIRQGDRSEALEVADRLRSVSSDPTIYWTLARRLHDRYSLEQFVGFFEEGGQELPPEDAPLIEPVEEEQYRYWWSRLAYKLGDLDEARRALEDPAEGFQPQWLAANLKPGREARRRAQSRVLSTWTDRLIAQWTHSR